MPDPRIRVRIRIHPLSTTRFPEYYDKPMDRLLVSDAANANSLDPTILYLDEGDMDSGQVRAVRALLAFSETGGIGTLTAILDYPTALTNLQGAAVQEILLVPDDGVLNSGTPKAWCEATCTDGDEKDAMDGLSVLA